MSEIELSQIKTLKDVYESGGFEFRRSRRVEKRKKRFVEDRFSYNEKFNERVSLLQADITKLKIDAIVNAANESLLGGGGVDGAIHKAAGPRLRHECWELNGCRTGDAKITHGYDLPAKHVIHTVGPIGEKPELLRSSYERSLQVFSDKKLKSMAFSNISTGVYGYPRYSAGHVAVSTVRKWLENHPDLDQVERIIFCVFEDENKIVYQDLLPIYFPPSSETEQEAGGIEEEQEVKKAKLKDSEEKESENAEVNVSFSSTFTGYSESNKAQAAETDASVSSTPAKDSKNKVRAETDVLAPLAEDSESNKTQTEADASVPLAEDLENNKMRQEEASFTSMKGLDAESKRENTLTSPAPIVDTEKETSAPVDGLESTDTNQKPPMDGLENTGSSQPTPMDGLESTEADKVDSTLSSIPMEGLVDTKAGQETLNSDIHIGVSENTGTNQEASTSSKNSGEKTEVKEIETDPEVVKVEETLREKEAESIVEKNSAQHGMLQEDEDHLHGSKDQENHGSCDIISEIGQEPSDSQKVAPLQTHGEGAPQQKQESGKDLAHSSL